MSASVALIDYETGNIRSLFRSIEDLGFSPLLTRDPRIIRDAAHIVLPGVGAFGQGMARLRDFGLADLIREEATRGKPVLGICLGMQLLADEGEENGRQPGLGIIPGVVRRLAPSAGGKVPHMGWNDLARRASSPVLEGIDPAASFYFCHSYHFVCREAADVMAQTDHGGLFASMVRRGSVTGLQFHPEKSHAAGRTILKNCLRPC